MTTRGALKQEDGETQEDKMQSTNQPTRNINGTWKMIQTLYLGTIS